MKSTLCFYSRCNTSPAKPSKSSPFLEVVDGQGHAAAAVQRRGDVYGVEALRLPYVLHRSQEVAQHLAGQHLFHVHVPDVKLRLVGQRELCGKGWRRRRSYHSDLWCPTCDKYIRWTESRSKIFIVHTHIVYNCIYVTHGCIYTIYVDKSNQRQHFLLNKVGI